MCLLILFFFKLKKIYKFFKYFCWSTPVNVGLRRSQAIGVPELYVYGVHHITLYSSYMWSGADPRKEKVGHVPDTDLLI